VTNKKYVHGYTSRETTRLVDQATTLQDLLHADTVYPPGSTVLEAGCGVGAQTVILARNSPDARFTSIDISEESLSLARRRVAAEGLGNVSLQRGDVFALPFREESFDHVFVCFLLEHLRKPMGALHHLKRALKPGGSLTVIEGDHGSAYFHPDSSRARVAIHCLIEIQARMGGNALLGRALYPLLTTAGYRDVRVSPKTVYVDSSKPELVQGFTKDTFIAMVDGVREQVISKGLVQESQWEQGIEDLYRTTYPDGTFVYSFFKGRAVK
jgi:SAM-dependent methyltransferase